MGYYVIKKSVPRSYLLDSEFYFVLKAENHKVIATSEMYSSKQAAENGIASVQANGPSQTIIDKT